MFRFVVHLKGTASPTEIILARTRDHPAIYEYGDDSMDYIVRCCFHVPQTIALNALHGKNQRIMTQSLLLHADPRDVAAIDLERVLQRLDHKILSPEADPRLQHSNLERLQTSAVSA